MAKLEFLMIHCSATKPSFDVTAAHIIDWHTSPKPIGRGWSKIGYSDLLKIDGEIEQLVEYNEDEWITSDEITNGAKGFNGKTRHVCLAGGQDEEGNDIFGFFSDCFNDRQFLSLRDYVHRFLSLHPDCKVMGHYQVSKKKCPGFDVPEFLKLIGVNNKNIYDGNI